MRSSTEVTPAAAHAASFQLPVAAYETAETTPAIVPMGPGIMDATEATFATTFRPDLMLDQLGHCPSRSVQVIGLALQ